MCLSASIDCFLKPVVFAVFWAFAFLAVWPGATLGLLVRALRVCLLIVLPGGLQLRDDHMLQHAFI